MVTTCSIAYQIIKIDIACNSCFRLQFVVLGYSRWTLPSFCVLRVFFPNFITLWFRANDTFDVWFVAQMHQSHIGQCSLGRPERNCIRLNPHVPFILWALWTAMATPLSTLVDGPSISLGGMWQRGNLLHMEFSNARCYCNLGVSRYMYAFNMRYGHILLLQLVECGISQEILHIGFSFPNASMEHEPKWWKKKSITMVPRIDSRESSNLDCLFYFLICTLYSLAIVYPDQLLIVSCSPLSAHKVP